MHIKLTQGNFSKALSFVSRVASSKTTLDILNNILIKVKNNKISISATDLEVAITSIIPGEVIEEGSITIPARLLTDYINSIPESNMELELNKTRLKISSGRFESSINGTVADEFPELPQETNNKSITLDSKLLSHTLQQTLIAVSRDMSRPILTGLCFTNIDNHLVLAGTDGYRLAEKVILKSKDTPNCIIPATALNDLMKIIQDDDEKIQINNSESQISFIIGNTTLISRLIDGNYPSYRQLIPESSDISFEVNKSDLINITKVASLFARESAGSITISVSEGEIKINSVESQVGVNTSSAEAKTTGRGEVTLNSRYLLDALNTIDGDEVRFRFSGKISPCVLTSTTDDSYQHIIMPLKS